VRVVVDTNVLIAANGRSTHVGISCTARCAELLLEVQNAHVLLDDLELAVFEEYKRYCNFDGQPGPGDLFFAWYVRSRGTAGAVESIPIGSKSKVEASLPLPLRKMDSSDKKFLAVYLAGNADQLFNATDSDWSHLSGELQAAGVMVSEVCPESLKLRAP
jgi:predicted nucleic acid-binding protein